MIEQEKIAHFTKRELHEYEESLKAFRDLYSVTKTSFNKGKVEGFAEGKAEGIAEGMAKGKVEGVAEGVRLMAKKMKDGGLDVNEISRITSLPLSEIEKL